MKRFWVTLLTLLVLAPAVISPEEAITTRLALSQKTNAYGDVIISWNPDALEEFEEVSMTIGYTYEDKGKKYFYSNDFVDPDLGEALFRNMSLEEDFRFRLELKTETGIHVKRGFDVNLPTPQRQRSIDQSVSLQLEYIDKTWQSRDQDDYIYIEENNCANFASQTLAARGMAQSAVWKQENRQPTSAWVSATALNAYLSSTTGVKRLLDGQREQVKLGDLVFFDWDRSGDSDHVGVVNHIQRQADGTIKIFYAGHTSHKHYRSVDWAIQVLRPNARVEYLSIPSGN